MGDALLGRIRSNDLSPGLGGVHMLESFHMDVARSTNYGAASLMGGVLIVLFGGGGLLALVVTPITLLAGVAALRRNDRGIIRVMAILGILLASVGIVLAFGFHYYGIVWETFLKSYLP